VSEAVSWTDGGWTYALKAEGHRWRFTADRPADEPGGKPMHCDFGLMPGGAFVAIERLVQARPAEAP